MKVILSQDVPNLGEEGDVKEVAGGYARNFLLPRRMVLPYNSKNAALIETRRAQIEARKEEKRKEALGIKERLESEPLVIEMSAGANGKLFGSVTAGAIAEALEKKGIRVERKRIDVPDKTLKTVGSHSVQVRLYSDERAELTVKVEASGGKSEQSVSSPKPKASQRAASQAEEAAPEKTPEEAAAAVEGIAEKTEKVADILEEAMEATEGVDNPEQEAEKEEES